MLVANNNGQKVHLFFPAERSFGSTTDMAIDWHLISNLDQIDADNADDLYDQLDQVMRWWRVSDELM